MSMPDTFNSWFLVTELHVWMLMAKAMEYGPDGRVIRNKIVEAMWNDVNDKAKKLGVSRNVCREMCFICLLLASTFFFLEWLMWLLATVTEYPTVMRSLLSCLTWSYYRQSHKHSCKVPLCSLVIAIEAERLTDIVCLSQSFSLIPSFSSVVLKYRE